MPLQIVRGDIVDMGTDAIVNAANSALQAGGGVCGAIFRAAGHTELQKACNEIGYCPTGSSVITPGFALASPYIIHTVGPVWQGGNQNEETMLRSCYRSALELARDKGLHSIAFPLISSGIYGYPKEEALQVATEAIGAFLLQEDADMEVTLVVFDKKAFRLSQRLVDEVRQYIDDRYSDAAHRKEHDRSLGEVDEQGPYCVYASNLSQVTLEDADQDSMEIQVLQQPCLVGEVEDYLLQASKNFTERLLYHIGERDMTDADAYHKANVSRQVFSNIRSKKGYQPKKETVLAFCIALELDLGESLALLKTAGYTLSDSITSDLIIQYFIEQREYDIHLVNQTLFEFDQKLLGV